MQTLIQILKTGYGYDRSKEDGTWEHILVAPNKYMISAARAIEHLARTLETCNRLLEQEQALSRQFSDDCVKYRKTIEELTNATKSDSLDSHSS